MKLWYNRTVKDPTYFIQMGFRNGKKTSTRNVARIGKHSELLAQGIEDPLAYARQKVAEANEEQKKGKVSMEVKIDFAEKVKASDALASSSTILGIGYFFLQAVYHQLHLNTFFKDVTKDRKFTFDPNQVNRFLTFARILDPDSKLGTCRNLSHYYEKPDFGHQHVLRTMDILYDNYQAYISYLYEQSGTIVKRDNSVCYFDCTNYYFETETEDVVVDEVTGEILKGFRQYGPSKEHRPNPLVEMGLFIDSRGIPISMCIAPGAKSEQQLAIPQEKEITQMFGGKKFIYCADAGLNSLDIRLFNSLGGRSFIVTQSVKKLADTLQTAVFNDFEYKLLSNGEPVTIDFLKSFDHHDEKKLNFYNDCAFKILTADHAVDTGLTEIKVYKNGKKREVRSKAQLKQTIIVTFSRKMLEYQRHIRNNQIQRARNLLKNLDPESYKKGPHDVTRFIRKASEKKSDEKYEINEERIKEEEKYDGYYAIATNLEPDKGEPEEQFVQKILSINESRYKIEECFRIMKTNFGSRPVNHHLKERITAHFMICYTALLVYRLLEAKLNDYGKTLKEGARHFTTDNIIETLQHMEVANVQDLYYLSTYTGSQTLNALNAVYDLQLDRKYYQPKELNKKLRKIL
jgi:transposase